MAGAERLNVVDEAGNIIGEDTRVAIHRLGLLHRETHVWLYTPQGEVIFQLRSDTVDIYPNLLDASVGGHVEIGETFESTAVLEMQEEAGLTITIDMCTFVQMVRTKVSDPVTSTINNVIRAIYAFKYNGSISDLRLEEGKAAGFEAWPLEKLLAISDEDRKRFIPSVFDDSTIVTFKKIKSLL